MKRNTIFGAAALLVAGAAIGAGSVVSQNAMADTGAPAPASQITMVNIGADGKAVQCTFSGADAAALLPAGLPAGAVADAHVVMGVAQMVPTDGSLPELQVSPGAPPANGQVISGVVSADTGQNGIVVNGQPADVHEGTAAESAAIHDQAVEMAKNIPAGGTVTGTDGVVVSGGANVVTASSKP